MKYSSQCRPPIYTEILDAVDLIVDYFLTDESPLRDLPMVVGHQVPPLSQDVIYYNCEMLTAKDRVNDILNRCRCKDIIEIWDYSKENVNIFKKNGFDAKHVPIRLVGSYLEKIQQFSKCEKIYDVGFCGSLSPRRAHIMQELIKSGLAVKVLSSIYGEERDRELAKCKIILNIHYFEEDILFERTRCEQWLTAGYTCVSELSLDEDDRCIYVPYSELVKTICRLVEKMKESK